MVASCTCTPGGGNGEHDNARGCWWTARLHAPLDALSDSTAQWRCPSEAAAAAAAPHHSVDLVGGDARPHCRVRLVQHLPAYHACNPDAIQVLPAAQLHCSSSSSRKSSPSVGGSTVQHQTHLGAPVHRWQRQQPASKPAVMNWHLNAAGDSAPPRWGCRPRSSPAWGCGPGSAAGERL